MKMVRRHDLYGVEILFLFEQIAEILVRIASLVCSGWLILCVIFLYVLLANITPAGRPEVFQVEFRLGDRSATYELVARSAYNPFRFEELEQFRCPQSL